MQKELALGMMRLPIDSEGKIDFAETNRLVDYFLDQGFRKFDTAELYHNTFSEHAVRECIVKRHPRDSFEIADKLTSWRIPEGMTAEQFFRKQLETTGLEYFDRYLIHSVEEKIYQGILDHKYFDFLFEKKEKGLIREAGFSFHGTPELLDNVLTEYPEVDFVQLQINYIDWDHPMICSGRCYETARKHGKKILIMEPVKGGMLASLPEEAEAILKESSPEASIASWAIRFAAGLDGVDTLLSGISNMEQMQDNTALMKDFHPLSDEELKVIGKVRASLSKIPRVECTGCKYCTTACPMELPIPNFFMVLNNERMFGSIPHVKNNYKWISASHKPSDCVNCGCCTSVCPQHLDIPFHLSCLAKWAENNGL